jgi:DNA modification methylase
MKRYELKSGTIWQGDCLAALKKMPEQSVHCVVTSPPYWALRDYSACSCSIRRYANPVMLTMDGANRKPEDGSSGPIDTNDPRCRKKPDPKCELCQGTGEIAGVKEKQLGCESSPDCGTLGQAQCGRCFVCAMVAVFRGVRRVLRDDGTAWVNLGDSYASGGGVNQSTHNGLAAASERADGKKRNPKKWASQDRVSKGVVVSVNPGLPSGNLVGVPWRVALALQADGWILRQDIVWEKAAPMPESVKNRCTKAHEYVFLFAKQPGYFYDAEAISEPGVHRINPKAKPMAGRNAQSSSLWRNAGTKDVPVEKGQDQSNAIFVEASRNKRSVWKVETPEVLQWLAEQHPEVFQSYLASLGHKSSVWKIASQGYSEAHFACYPPKLIEPMILAGTSAYGCCADCGAPYKRITKEKQIKRDRPNEYVKRKGAKGTGNSCANTVAGVEVKTIGWQKTCTCKTNKIKPCVVMDPFLGSGTSAMVAIQNHRHFVGIELNPDYIRLCLKRIRKGESTKGFNL